VRASEFSRIPTSLYARKSDEHPLDGVFEEENLDVSRVAVI